MAGPNIPAQLVIVDGEIKLANGGDLKTYLANWQRYAKIKDGTLISVVPREQYVDVVERAMISRAWGA
jgi:hypothetical protein